MKHYLHKKELEILKEAESEETIEKQIMRILHEFEENKSYSNKKLAT